MKQIETAFKLKRKYAAIMLACFLYAGFAIMFFGFQVYSDIWRSDTSPLPQFDQNRIFDINDTNFAARNNVPRNFEMRRLSPVEAVTAPISIVLLISGVVSFIAGLAIWQLIREKEIKGIKNEMASNLLLPEEKKIIDALRASNFEATQARLAKDTGLNKVQVHRAIKKLEAKGIVEKHGFGMTNKILMKKELLE